MKRVFVIVLCIVLSACFLCACDKDEPIPTVASINLSPVNDILTYTKVDAEKTPLIIWTVGGLYISDLIDKFEGLYPDVQVIIMDITGGDGYTSPYFELMQAGIRPDVLFVAGGLANSALNGDVFTDLSAEPYISNFNLEAINRVAKDGHVYVLPGLSAVGSISYNKTMFREYGWQVPTTFDEFVALCTQITADTGGAVQPWNPNAKYDSELIGAMQGFTYGEILAGIDNYSWYMDFLNGEATFAENMQPLYTAWQKLLDADIIKTQHFTYSATTRGNEFLDGKIAMINQNNTRIMDADFEVGYMPFVGKTAEDAYLIDNLTGLVGIPKNDNRSPEVSLAADKFMTYYASSDGQQAYIGDSFYISNVKSVPSAAATEMAELAPCFNEGKMFSLASFERPNTPPAYHFFTEIYDDLKEIQAGTLTAQQSMTALDTEYAAVLASGYSDKRETIATATESFTSLETSNFFADTYRSTADADIGLIVHGAVYRGNVTSIMKGALNSSTVTVLKPRSLENKSTLVKLSMTGAQLKAALNAPVGNGRTENAVYAFSGLKATVAPWKPLGEKYLSLSLADGTPIDDTKLYTVAAWKGTVDDKYITETLQEYNTPFSGADSAMVQATHAGSFEDLLTYTLKTKGTIAPINDGRITLVWD